MSDTLKPVGDKILIEFRTQTAPSGLILPESARTAIADDAAVVLAIGTDPDIVIKVGDEVIFNPHAALPIKLQDKEYVLLTQKAIICITNYDREGR